MNADQPRMTVVHLRRWISALLFLAVFFLPIHIHLATAATAQLSKECSCVQGTRTQLASIGSSPTLFTPGQTTPLAVLTTLVLAFSWSHPHNVRAPPFFASL